MKRPLLGAVAALLCTGAAWAVQVPAEVESEVKLESAQEARLQAVLRRVLSSEDVLVIVDMDVDVQTKPRMTELLPGVPIKDTPAGADMSPITNATVKSISATVMLDDSIPAEADTLVQKTAEQVLGLDLARGDAVTVKRMRLRAQISNSRPSLKDWLGPGPVVSLLWLGAFLIALALVYGRFLGPLLRVIREAGLARAVPPAAPVLEGARAAAAVEAPPAAPAVPDGEAAAAAAVAVRAAQARPRAGADAGTLETSLTEGNPRPAAWQAQPRHVDAAPGMREVPGDGDREDAAAQAVVGRGLPGAGRLGHRGILLHDEDLGAGALVAVLGAGRQEDVGGRLRGDAGELVGARPGPPGLVEQDQVARIEGARGADGDGVPPRRDEGGDVRVDGVLGGVARDRLRAVLAAAHVPERGPRGGRQGRRQRRREERPQRRPLRCSVVPRPIGPSACQRRGALLYCGR